MYNNKPDKSARNKTILVAVTIFTLVTFNIVQLYISQKREDKQKSKYESKQLELVNTYEKLDSISIKLGNRINLLQNLGGKVDSLINIKNQLEREKFALRQSKDLAENRYLEIKGKIQGYNELLSAKDIEIQELKDQTEDLLLTKEALLEKTGELNTRVSMLETEKGLLEGQVKKASIPTARTLRFFAINNDGIDKEGTEFKVNQLEHLKITVYVEPNSIITQPSMKTIYMSIIDPNGQELSNSKAETFKQDGKDIFYAQSADFIYRAEGQDITLEYSRSGEFSPGQYKVSIHCDGRTICKRNFIVK